MWMTCDADGYLDIIERVSHEYDGHLARPVSNEESRSMAGRRRIFYGTGKSAGVKAFFRWDEVVPCGCYEVFGLLPMWARGFFVELTNGVAMHFTRVNLPGMWFKCASMGPKKEAANG